MRPLIAMVLLLIAALATANEQVITVQHDSARGVTCWVLEGAGISCLPDSSLPQGPNGTTNAEGRATRASQSASSEETTSATNSPLPPALRAQL